MRKAGIAVLTGIILSSVVAPATAQTRLTEGGLLVEEEASYWGLRFSFTPKWTSINETWAFWVPPDSAINNGPNVDITGPEWQVGFVRGRPNGSDWGLSLVRKFVKDGSRIDDPDSAEFFCSPTPCPEFDLFLETSGVGLTGVLIHRSATIGRIGSRVQIGANFSGGMGIFDGTYTRQDVDFTGGTGPVVVTIVEDAEGPMGRFMPLGTVEAAFSVIAAPGLKVRVSGGLDWPGYRTFNVNLLYFFGTPR